MCRNGTYQVHNRGAERRMNLPRSVRRVTSRSSKSIKCRTRGVDHLQDPLAELAVISGVVALQFFTRNRVQDSHLDIYTYSVHAEIGEWLLEEEEYIFSRVSFNFVHGVSRWHNHSLVFPRVRAILQKRSRSGTNLGVKDAT